MGRRFSWTITAMSRQLSFPRRIRRLACAALWLVPAALAAEEAPPHPNILWITCEDMSPHLGCYGEGYAVTPNLDRLAGQGVLYTRAFATAGVCAPARSCLITGMYPPSIGSHHMRCQGRLPAGARFFPEYLREAGYHATNNSKTDYNLPARAGAWDESSPRAHWRQRPDRSRPFFAVFNLTATHESQIRLPEAEHLEKVKGFTAAELHDPAKAPIPPYHPDVPEVRRDWARYHDRITRMDREAGAILRELEEDGLAGDTIVFFFSDHGAGMPRSKRWLYDSSLRVPLIVRFPAKYRHLAPGEPSSRTDRLVSFVDFAPAVLSLAGIRPPAMLQGRAFLGPHAGPPREYVHGHRDRMDERYDFCRAVSDGRFKYIRNFLPHLPWFGSQHVSYMFEMPTMRAWERLAAEGKLSGPAALWMAATRPSEELYDTRDDPHEVVNLAAAPGHRETLERLRRECRRWQEEIADLGLLPEDDVRARFGSEPPYDAVRRDPSLYPLARLLAAADVVPLARRADEDPGADWHLSGMMNLLDDPDPAVRWWGAQALIAFRGRTLITMPWLQSKASRPDPAPAVRLAVAEAMLAIGPSEAALETVRGGLGDGNEWVRLQAANSADRLDERARPLLDALEARLQDPNEYVRRVAAHAVAGLRGAEGSE
jgi:uncharacterized sulfatase